MLIIQHPRGQVNIGTTRLLMLSLSHCQLVTSIEFSAVRTAEPHDAAFHDAIEQSASSLILYPSDTAVDVESLTPFCEHVSTHAQPNTPSDGSERCECGCAKGHPYSTLIAIDGSWKHAKEISRLRLFEVCVEGLIDATYSLLT